MNFRGFGLFVEDFLIMRTFQAVFQAVLVRLTKGFPFHCLICSALGLWLPYGIRDSETGLTVLQEETERERETVRDSTEDRGRW